MSWMAQECTMIARKTDDVKTAVIASCCFSGSRNLHTNAQCVHIAQANIKFQIIVMIHCAHCSSGERLLHSWVTCVLHPITVSNKIPKFYYSFYVKNVLNVANSEHTNNLMNLCIKSTYPLFHRHAVHDRIQVREQPVMFAKSAT